MFFVFPVIFYAVLIYYLSSFKGGLPAIGVKLSDKVLHIIEFLILGWLTARAIHFGSMESISKKLLLISIISGILYGASDEIHQLFVHGRSSEWLDWFADCIGVVLGVLVYRRYHKIESKFFGFPKDSNKLKDMS